MLNITATDLRGGIFAILKKVESSENVVITHNKKSDWRKQCTKKLKLLVSMDELIKPVEDIWEDYI